MLRNRLFGVHFILRSTRRSFVMCEPGDIEELNRTCGFGRPLDGSPVGTVDLFNKHLFIQTGLYGSCAS